MNVKVVKTLNTLLIINKFLKMQGGILRTADAVKNGVSRTILGNLVKNDKLVRIAHGQYISPDNIADEMYMLQQRSNSIIFSHETALFLYDMVERTPFLHSVTIPSNTKLSPILSEDCKVYYVKPEIHNLGLCFAMSKMGNKVKAYDIERTVCDILRRRSRIDNQTLAEAIKSYTAHKDKNWNKLREYAEIFRMTKILRQYLEVLI